MAQPRWEAKRDAAATATAAERCLSYRRIRKGAGVKPCSILSPTAPDGSTPDSSLVFDSQENLYGTEFQT